MIIALLTLIGLPLLTSAAALALSHRLGHRVGYIAVTAPTVSLALLTWLTFQAGPRPRLLLEASWIPSLDVKLSFLLDGLSIFYGFVICGMGALVCWYAVEYLGRTFDSPGRFYACLLMFMTAMLGAVFSDNLLLLFVFWELTGVASFLLIGYVDEEAAARAGARQALLVTAATGLCLLAGLILIGLNAGSYSLAAILEASARPDGPRWPSMAVVLILTGIFGKSAQFPFHFWLSGAMAAPTPVSAYLHSATMVKLGVFLAARFFPIFHSADLWFWLVSCIAFATMLIGAYLSLRATDLKAILAYTTVSQLGFLLGVYGTAGPAGVRFDFLHVLSHALYKGSLFMVAGIVDNATRSRDIRRLGGLARYMPLTTLAAAVGTSALAALPPTSGFISKELLLADLSSLFDRNAAAAGLLFAMTAVSAALSVAVAARLFFNVFAGAKPEELTVERPGWKVQTPPVLLACAALLPGIAPRAFHGMVEWLHVPGLHAENLEPLRLWHGFTPELFVTLLAFLAGTALYLRLDKRGWWTDLPVWLRFDTAFERGLNGLTKFATALTHVLRADSPPAYLPIIIFFLLAVLASTIAAAPDRFQQGLLSIQWNASPLRSIAAGMIIAALIGMLILKRWTTQLIALSVAGFFQTLYFALYRAPDLAMTQILVESATVVMMLFLLSHFPATHREVRSDRSRGLGRFVHAGLSAGIGIAMGGLVLFAGLHRHPDPIGPRLLELSLPAAEGTNAVNTILVDFRGFDTLIEITVLLIATLGALGLMMRYKRGRSKGDPAPPPGFFLGRGRKS